MEIAMTAIFRIHAIRRAKFAGEFVNVPAEQIAGDFGSFRDAQIVAEKFTHQTGVECKIDHVGGVESAPLIDHTAEALQLLRK